jgi:hypothetical protein
MFFYKNFYLPEFGKPLISAIFAILRGISVLFVIPVREKAFGPKAKRATGVA